MTQIAFSGVGIDVGGQRLLDAVTFTVTRGQRWGVIGRNGTGKTTLFRVLVGEVTPAKGAVVRDPALRVSLLEQHREIPGASTIWEVVAGPFADLLALERSLAEQATRIGELGDATPQQVFDRYARDLERFEREGGYQIAPRIDAVLQGLGFDPDDARSRRLEGLSGGERGRVGLARQLAAAPDVLLLDEPTNHLDLETTVWLENYLLATDATVLLVSHDRAFLDRVVDNVLHLEGGTATPYAAGYAGFVAQRAERRQALARAVDKQRKVIETEEDYIRRNIAGGNSRQAKGRRRRLARVERLSPPPDEEGVMALRLVAGERSGEQVLVADEVDLRIGDRVLLRDFSARIGRGDVIGLVGPNGAGKSTLVHALASERCADGGEIRVPESVRAAHYRQDLAQVPPERTLYDAIADLRPSWPRGAVQGHLGRFGFSGEEVFRRTATLSGGERARVGLAILMLSGANFLLLDEPTNHLDVESIEALEDAIEAFEGTVLLVSHDRALLRGLTTRTWVMHDGRILDYPGGFDEWETASAERGHAAAVAAAEAESGRRVRETRETRRARDERRAAQSADRTARRALADAEAEVARAETAVEKLRARLEDPDLYAMPAGVEEAAGLGRELDVARVMLDAAYERWAAANEAVEQRVAEA